MPLALAVLLLGSSACRAGSLFDDLGAALSFSSEEGDAWAQLSFVNEVTAFVPDDPAPGLLFSDASSFIAPRISMTVDAGLGQSVLVHARARADRGFDPGTEDDGDLRLDEYFVEAALPGPGRPRLRVGKFATAFGGWVERHLSWDNPLITAPAIYEDMLPITDQAAPADAAAFAARRDVPENKPAWVPMVWGPSYATGASLSAGTPAVTLTFEVKNSALSSRPETWDVVSGGFETDPTFTGRLGWRPGAAWNVGASASHGPYLQPSAGSTLPQGRKVDGAEQTTLGLDITYELHRLQLWGEVVKASFDVPRVGRVDAVSAFAEGRYKLAPRWWLAGRLNHSRFDEAPGSDEDWDRDLSRLDMGIGFRQSAHLQVKAEYSVGDQAGTDTNGNQLFALQMVLWF